MRVVGLQVARVTDVRFGTINVSERAAASAQCGKGLRGVQAAQLRDDRLAMV
jgi:hypothetical protein